MAPPSARAGFTLIELLVGLAVMGMAATMVMQVLGIAAILDRREQRGDQALDEVIAAEHFLRSQVARLRPLPMVNAETPAIHLRGTATMLGVAGPPLDRNASGSLQWFRLIRSAEGALILYTLGMRRTGVDVGGHDLTGWTPHVVIRGVRDLSIAYFGPARGRAPGERLRGWQSVWWERPTLPELIRIRIGFAPGDPRVWPDLLIQPQATKYGICPVDPTTGRCVEER
ncbi:prepilin-type N-terminal cleavage/methylation domain-containing protein [Sphingomonas sp. 8AM]|uniref:prepilin-type N-terminal cleavage/methylation domain-containing protein n=1 Tax=Sphingomonas sp. 8AM TaxID=2653170 RepID=UPI0012F1C4B4|nr:prepilin-type N-terminal cleavage/methylation domain-containing protein [Sphingomonas sp. 8AM]VXD01411.1 Prepilin-type N-terminal cleavage/methylation domain-containing protein [Sphingomonas sp. 8AM]